MAADLLGRCIDGRVGCRRHACSPPSVLAAAPGRRADFETNRVAPCFIPQLRQTAVLAPVTCLYSGEVGDACAASPVGLCGEPGGQNLLGQIVGECAVGQAQHAGVVPHPGTGCLPGIGAQGGADPGNLVRRDAYTRSGPTEKDTVIAIPARHGFGGDFCRQCRVSSAPGTSRVCGAGHIVGWLFPPLDGSDHNCCRRRCFPRVCRHSGCIR